MPARPWWPPPARSSGRHATVLQNPDPRASGAADKKRTPFQPGHTHCPPTSPARSTCQKSTPATTAISSSPGKRFPVRANRLHHNAQLRSNPPGLTFSLLFQPSLTAMDRRLLFQSSRHPIQIHFTRIDTRRFDGSNGFAFYTPATDPHSRAPALPGPPAHHPAASVPRRVCSICRQLPVRIRRVI